MNKYIERSTRRALTNKVPGKGGVHNTKSGAGGDVGAPARSVEAYVKKESVPL